MPRNRNIHEILDSITESDSENVNPDITLSSLTTSRSTQRVPCYCLTYLCNGKRVSQRTKSRHESDDIRRQ
ncbi:10822_t:CDS:1, partial [Dentiscutata heterogama]